MKEGHDFSHEKVFLGKTDLKITPIGVGTWQWGDRLYWEYEKSHTADDIRDAFQVSLDLGINFFDTAEVYGMGISEQLLGSFVNNLSDENVRSQLVIATKFFPFPWRLWKNRLKIALKGSLKRLGRPWVDLYQIHLPFPPVPIETWMRALAEAVEAGLIRAAGVSNYSISQMRRAYQELRNYGIPLASNQVPYSLLDRRVEKTGLLSLCQELGISLIAYSPLYQGVLSGKYHPENPLPGMRSRRYPPEYLKKIEPLIKLLRQIGEQHHGKTPAQVALNWVICKGGIAIPGAKNKKQALENSGALGWRLTKDEVEALDQVSDEVSS